MSKFQLAAEAEASDDRNDPFKYNQQDFDQMYWGESSGPSWNSPSAGQAMNPNNRAPVYFI